MSIRDDNYLGQGMRYVRRAHEPSVPFVPYGLLPLVGLLALLLWGLTSFAQNIQNQTETAARTALTQNNIDWATATASGQDITLTGTPPSQDAMRVAERVVRGARAEGSGCNSPPCVALRRAFGPISAAATPAVTPTPEPTTPAATPITGPYPEFEFNLANGTLSLQGDMPNELSRTTVVDTARAAVDNSRIFNVENNLNVTNTPTADGFLNVALRGVNTVSRCDRGRASFLGDYFSLRCELPDTRAASVQALASSPLPIGALGAIDILPNEAVASCEASMRTLLTTAKVRFDTGSARIDDRSSDLLDSIAAAARECPGRLRIEGHTDNTGSAFKNDELSGQRAEAVRAALVRRGLPVDRLVTEGYGSSQPAASNATAQGRAQNRRIEIRVVRLSE